MQRIVTLLFAALFSISTLPAQQYQNPVLPFDYSDPDLCRVGDDYYLTASSFNCSPGLPVLHSTDLVNWKIISYALDSVPNADFKDGKVAHGKAVWAPSIRYHKGRYFIFWGDPDYGIYQVNTDDPTGTWSKPVLVLPGKGFIDSTPLWDTNGKVYLVFATAGSRAKINSALFVQQLNADATSTIGHPVLIYDGTYDNSQIRLTGKVNHTIEGPKFYKHDGKYIILAPAGGVAGGWQLALRSDNVFGPYESKVVMKEGANGINGPHQGGWVSTASGQDWFMNFQELQPFGRVVHLNPVEWKDGWPVMGEDADGDGCGFPVARHTLPNLPACEFVMQASDEFDSTDLGLQWQWQANYEPWFGNTTNMGFMRVYGHVMGEEEINMFHVPNMLLQKIPSTGCTATAKVRVVAKDDEGRSGLIVMGLDYAALMVQKQGKKFALISVECKKADEGKEEKTDIVQTIKPTDEYNTGGTSNAILDIYLRVKIDQIGRCRFGYSMDGKKFKDLNWTFQAREGRWIGAKMGLVSMTTSQRSRSWIDCDWFHVDNLNEKKK